MQPLGLLVTTVPYYLHSILVCVIDFTISPFYIHNLDCL